MKIVEELIEENKGLIFDIVSKYSSYKSAEDLFQAGCVGIIEAYKNFDHTRGVKFTTYAYPYIFGEINKLALQDHSIKLSRDMYRLKAKIEKARGYLSQMLMRRPSSKELSEYLEVSEDILNSLINYKDPFSMDDLVKDDLSLHELISSKDIDYDTLITLKVELESLEEPERTIMFKRYFEDLTQSEVANLIGTTQVDISRKEKKALLKLRKTFTT